MTPSTEAVRVTLEYSTLIGGLQSGWKVAVRLSVPSAVPFLTVKVPAAEKLCLFPALGLLLPGFTHWASAERATSTVVTFRPRPEILKSAESVFPERVTLVAFLMKWTLAAIATVAVSPVSTATARRVMILRRIDRLLPRGFMTARVTERAAGRFLC